MVILRVDDGLPLHDEFKIFNHLFVDVMPVGLLTGMRVMAIGFSAHICAGLNKLVS